MRREVPAAVVITRTLPDGSTQSIMSCLFHQDATDRLLRSKPEGGTITMREADPSVHGCKGCLDDWAP